MIFYEDYVNAPEEVWAASINLSGLYSKTPMRCLLDINNDNDCVEWWSEDKNFSVRKLGLESARGYISFASTKKKDVVIFIDGVKATMKLMKTWCSTT